jgi:hypothetical protein
VALDMEAEMAARGQEERATHLRDWLFFAPSGELQVVTRGMWETCNDGASWTPVENRLRLSWEGVAAPAEVVMTRVARSETGTEYERRVAAETVGVVAAWRAACAPP